MSSLFNFDLVAEEGWELLNKYDYGTNMKEIPKVVNKRVKEMPTSKILSFIMFGAKYQFNKKENIELILIEHAESINITRRMFTEEYREGAMYLSSNNL